MVGSVHGIEGLSLEGLSLLYSSFKIYIVKSRLNMWDIEKGKKMFLKMTMDCDTNSFPFLLKHSLYTRFR